MFKLTNKVNGIINKKIIKIKLVFIKESLFCNISLYELMLFIQNVIYGILSIINYGSEIK